CSSESATSNTFTSFCNRQQTRHAAGNVHPGDAAAGTRHGTGKRASPVGGDYFTGTRCFSSSVQLMTTLICWGVALAALLDAASLGPPATMATNRLSRAISYSRSTRPRVCHRVVAITSGFPMEKTGSAVTLTTYTRAP